MRGAGARKRTGLDPKWKHALARGAGDARTHPPHWSFHLPVVFGTGGIMNATIELLIVALCWLAVLGVVAAIIVAAVIG